MAVKPDRWRFRSNVAGEEETRKGNTGHATQTFFLIAALFKAVRRTSHKPLRKTVAVTELRKPACDGFDRKAWCCDNAAALVIARLERTSIESRAAESTAALAGRLSDAGRGETGQ